MHLLILIISLVRFVRFTFRFPAAGPPGSSGSGTTLAKALFLRFPGVRVATAEPRPCPSIRLRPVRTVGPDPLPVLGALLQPYGFQSSHEVIVDLLERSPAWNS